MILQTGEDFTFVTSKHSLDGNRWTIKIFQTSIPPTSYLLTDVPFRREFTHKFRIFFFRFSFLGNMRTYPRSGFRSGGTSECTLVPVFVRGEHPPKPPFGKPPFCQPAILCDVFCSFPGFFRVRKVRRILDVLRVFLGILKDQ